MRLQIAWIRCVCIGSSSSRKSWRERARHVVAFCWAPWRCRYHSVKSKTVSSIAMHKTAQQKPQHTIQVFHFTIAFRWIKWRKKKGRESFSQSKHFSLLCHSTENFVCHFYDCRHRCTVAVTLPNWAEMVILQRRHPLYMSCESWGDHPMLWTDKQIDFPFTFSGIAIEWIYVALGEVQAICNGRNQLNSHKTKMCLPFIRSSPAIDTTKHSHNHNHKLNWRWFLWRNFSHKALPLYTHIFYCFSSELDRVARVHSSFLIIRYLNCKTIYGTCIRASGM